MKASELIESLQKVLNTHGDLEVSVWTDGGEKITSAVFCKPVGVKFVGGCGLWSEFICINAEEFLY